MVSHGDAAEKDILKRECVCNRHFISGKAAATWNKHNIDWFPTLHLVVMEYKGNEQKEKKEGFRRKGQKSKGMQEMCH